jgi:large subunit ribosomal protein L15
VKASKQEHTGPALKLGFISPAAGSRKKKKRVGRGTSSGHGKTCCRGQKGQKSRSGGVKHPGFEGGQTPLYRRLPKIDRFKNFLFKKVFSIVNVSEISRFDGVVNVDKLVEAGLVCSNDKVKILGDGEIKKSLTVEAHAFSAGAKKKIEAAGGKAVLIGGQVAK